MFRVISMKDWHLLLSGSTQTGIPWSVARINRSVRSKGGTSPTLGPISFIFMQFSAKICRIIGYTPTSGVTAPSPPRKILDPSLNRRTHVRVCDGVPDVPKIRKKSVYFSCSYILLTEWCPLGVLKIAERNCTDVEPLLFFLPTKSMLNVITSAELNSRNFPGTWLYLLRWILI